MGLCSSSNVKYQTNNPAHEITCPEGALRVKPGRNSLSQAVTEAKEKGIGILFLLSGMHDENGFAVTIDFALKVIGQNRDNVKIHGGFSFEGKNISYCAFANGKHEEDSFLSNCTVTGAKENGIMGYGATMHLKNVCVELCRGCGVCVATTKLLSTTRNTMTDCNVNNNGKSGVCVMDGGCMTIDGGATTIHHNVLFGENFCYGLDTCDSSASIHLKSLTKESISRKNGGGGNYGGDRIKTI